MPESRWRRRWSVHLAGGGGADLMGRAVRATRAARPACLRDDVALVQHRDHVRDAERRRHVVADHDAGDVEPLLGLPDHVVDVAGALTLTLAELDERLAWATQERPG